MAMTLSCGTTPDVPNKPANINANTTKAVVPAFKYEIVKTYPHDPKAFTQGLEYRNGLLYEGTGGKKGDDFYSSLRKVEFATGKVIQKYDLPREYF
ncbi:MAG TPA: glutaminyl-peptide cyclotransferase, partial [Pyrinomonadaceae bacterium]|nr:glutaminyl-peptide cyclotransferase [Pyrinomonadaceae bacterium]